MAYRTMHANLLRTKVCGGAGVRPVMPSSFHTFMALLFVS